MTNDRPDIRTFRSIIKASTNEIYSEVEKQCKIDEAFNFLVDFYESGKRDSRGREFKGMKLTGMKKDKKIVEWYRKNIIKNRIREQVYY